MQANFEQAGFALYKNDDAFVKLAHVAIFETRQTEWAKFDYVRVSRPAS